MWTGSNKRKKDKLSKKLNLNIKDYENSNNENIFNIMKLLYLLYNDKYYKSKPLLIDLICNPKTKKLEADIKKSKYNSVLSELRKHVKDYQKREDELNRIHNAWKRVIASVSYDAIIPSIEINSAINIYLKDILK